MIVLTAEAVEAFKGMNDSGYAPEVRLWTVMQLREVHKDKTS